jgi:hypothetical protein
VGCPPYRTVVRLLEVAGYFWVHLDGDRADDLLDLRLDRFLNHVYHYAVLRLSPEDKERFDTELMSPLEGESAKELKVSQSTIDQEMQAFDALAGMTSGR